MMKEFLGVGTTSNSYLFGHLSHWKNCMCYLFYDCLPKYLDWIFIFVVGLAFNFVSDMFSFSTNVILFFPEFNNEVLYLLKCGQSTHMASQHVTEEAVYLCTGNPMPKDIEQIAYWLLNESYTASFRCILGHELLFCDLRLIIPYRICLLNFFRYIWY